MLLCMFCAFIWYICNLHFFFNLWHFCLNKHVMELKICPGMRSIVGPSPRRRNRSHPRRVGRTARAAAMCPRPGKRGFAYSHRNVFGRNKKLNLSLERGQIDSIFRLNYTDPWIDGDNKRTSRTVMVQNSRTPGTLNHSRDRPDHGAITIGRGTACIEYSQLFRPKWSGTLGLIFQHAGAHDYQVNPVNRDSYNSQLTARGNP